MKRRFSLKFKLVDLIVILVSLVVCVGAIFVVDSKDIHNSSDPIIVEIQYHNDVIYEINFDDIKEEKVITLNKEMYGDLLGDFNIYINPEKGICVKDIECPNHICEKQNWVSIINWPIVCIPNGVVVTLKSNENIFIVG